jgi:hypothetical protein
MARSSIGAVRARGHGARLVLLLATAHAAPLLAEEPKTPPPAAPAPAPRQPVNTPAAPAAAAAPTKVEVVVEAGTSAGAGKSPPVEARGDYNLKLRDIEERVNQLKEKIFQSKARLLQLQEVVLHGTLAGAKAVLVHKNEMGSSFKLYRVQYSLDGAPIYNRVDNQGDLESEDELEIFNGSIAPGNHQISVYLEYKGYGYGVFSYLKGYTFKIKSSNTFMTEEGKVTTIRIVGFEQGGITTELKDRPTVRYDVETTKDLRAKPEEPPPASEEAPRP